MGKSQREKGKRGEREAAKALSGVLGVPVWRSQQYQGATGSADLVGVDGIHFEVKRTERLSLYAALEQATSDCGRDIPIVLHRRNGKPWLVIMHLDDLPSTARAVLNTTAKSNAKTPPLDHT